MIFDKEKLLRIFDETKDLKPRKNPKVTGYAGTGNREQRLGDRPQKYSDIELPRKVKK